MQQFPCNSKCNVPEPKMKTENIFRWVIVCMHKAKSNQKSIHNHLQGADKDKRHTQREREGGRRTGADHRSGQAGRQFNQICYKTVKVCDSDRKQDSKSHKGAVQAANSNNNLERFACQDSESRRVYHYAKRWSFCIPSLQRRSVPYMHASISMQQYQCLAIRRLTVFRLADSRTDRQQDTIQSFQHCGT